MSSRASSRRRTQKLAELEKQQRAQLNELEQARKRRSVVLANLEEQSHTRAQNLERLRSQQSGLEKLLRELRAAMERFPVEGNDAFTRLRGKLAWPVSGHLVARFGDARAGGVHWDGVLVATERGAPVKAVCRGRVIYADWLPGLGLLAIVDHGDGYLSLYGHNERLYKAAGEQSPLATPSPPPATAVAARARSCISRSARAASRSIRVRGSRPQTLRAGPQPSGRAAGAVRARLAARRSAGPRRRRPRPAADVIAINVLPSAPGAGAWIRQLAQRRRRREAQWCALAVNT